MRSIGLQAFPLPKSTTYKIAKDSTTTGDISKLLAEPFLAPKVTLKTQEQYQTIFKENKFQITYITTDMLIDYYLAEPNTLAAK